MKNSLLSYFGFALAAGIILVTPTFAAVSIDYVTIGNINNAADTVTPNPGFGTVGYEYKIGKNEVTISQYAEFLNAAATTDANGLWNSNMGSDANIAGITQSGSSGSFSYSVTGSGQRPITYVSWYDAARFTNWMHNGQGSGSTETGAYTLTGNTGLIMKNAAAAVWLPSENEWYKAAYYDPTKNGGAGGYWRFATQSDTLTDNDPAVAGAANYLNGDGFAVTQTSIGGIVTTQNYLTDAGAYGADSESFYGTNDQTGNVREWNDAIDGSERGHRGGDWNASGRLLPSSDGSSATPTTELSWTGFRVASVPEPSAVFMTLIAVGASLTIRRRSSL